MKRGSSSSSGSEKVASAGVITGSVYSSTERDDRKLVTKSSNSPRMSCTSDDSCAINELIEGRMDLKVILPLKTVSSAVINVERRTPMMDLLVSIATQYRFNAANYTISAGDHEFKASTPIGSLDVNEIAIVPKLGKSISQQKSQAQFPTTFRLQVNLPRNQLMVLRVTPTASIGAIKQIICTEKSLDPNKYQMVRFGGDTPQILDIKKTLSYYTLNEVTLMSNKSLTQFGMSQYGASAISSEIDLNLTQSPSPNSSTPNMKPSFSQSTPDVSYIKNERSVSITSIKSNGAKKRPAPPPPSTTNSVTVKSEIKIPDNSNRIKVKSSSTIATIHEDHNEMQNIIIKNAASEPLLSQENNAINNQSNNKLIKNANGNHVRHNSGSDSSGYHESVLSSDSPESSSGGAAGKNSSSTTTNNNRQRSGSRSTIGSNHGKKRRAPPPPNQIQPHIKNNQQEFDTDKDRNKKNWNNNNDSDGDQKMSSVNASVECMSDVSLPVSTSSASSSGAASASSINNRSLSPIVIDHVKESGTNGKKTPQLPSLPSIESIESTSLSPSGLSSPSPTIYYNTDNEPLERVKSSSPHVSKTHVHNDDDDNDGRYANILTNKGIALNTSEMKHEKGDSYSHSYNSTMKDAYDSKQDSVSASRPKPIESHDYDNHMAKDNSAVKESEFSGQSSAISIPVPASASALSLHSQTQLSDKDKDKDNNNNRERSPSAQSIVLSHMKELEPPAPPPAPSQSNHTEVAAPVSHIKAPAPGDGHDSGLSGSIRDCVEDKSQFSNKQSIRSDCKQQQKGMTVMITEHEYLIPPPPDYGDGADGADHDNLVMGAKCVLNSNGFGFANTFDAKIAFNKNTSGVGSDVNMSRQRYLHDGTLHRHIITGEDEHNYHDHIQSQMSESDNVTDICECESDIQQNYSEFELSDDMALPLPPPSPFQNSIHDEEYVNVNMIIDSDNGTKDGQGTGAEDEITSSVGQYAANDNDLTPKVKNAEVHKAKKEMGVEQISDTTATMVTPTMSFAKESETPVIVSRAEEDIINREIAVTLQTLNDTLDNIASEDDDFDEISSVELVIGNQKKNAALHNVSTNYSINNSPVPVPVPNSRTISVHVKHDNSESIEQHTVIDPKPQIRARSVTPTSSSSKSSIISLSPSPELITTNGGKSTVIVNRDNTSPTLSVNSTSKSISPSISGRTTVLLNKSPSPPPPSESPTPKPRSAAPSPEEEKLSADAVRQLCRPRVKLTNFTIGSYKKDVDIFAETNQNASSVKEPMTAPVTNNTSAFTAIKPMVVTASLKQDTNKDNNNQTQSKQQLQPQQSFNKSKVNITSISTTASNSSIEKPQFPVIQTLTTAAPKINRIQSWSGVRNFTVDRRTNVTPLQPPKERCISQVAINKDSTKVSIKNPSSEINSQSQPKFNDDRKSTKFGDDLKSPHLVAQTLTGPRDYVKNRSQSPQVKDEKQQVQVPIKEQNQIPLQKQHTTISIRQQPITSTVNNYNNQHHNQEHTSEIRVIGKTNTPQATVNHNSGNRDFSQLYKELQRELRQHHDNANGNGNNNNNANNNNANGNNPSQSIHIEKKTNNSNNVQLVLNQSQNNHTKVINDNHNPSVPPPPPMPLIPDTRAKSATLGSKTPIGIIAPKGWNSDRTKSATMRNVNSNATNVPNTKRVESAPSHGLNVRDAMLNEIRSFGGKNSLKKVSKNSPQWQLQVHGNNVKS